MKTTQINYFHLLIFFSLFLFLASCSDDKDTNSNKNEGSTAIPVEAGSVSRGDISAFYTATATLEAEEEATIVSKVRGIIDEFYIEEGEKVKAGDIIAQLEVDQYRIDAERAKATLNRLENDFKRNKELFEQDMISMETLQNAQFEYESQKAAYELTELNLIHTAIKSPISGVISERFIKKGNMIGIDQPAFRVTNINLLQAILHIPEHEIEIIRPGQTAQLQFDAIQGKIFEGRVERISPVVDSQTGTFKVTVHVVQYGDILRPGMFGRIKILYEIRQNVLKIPRNAVIPEDNAQNVYVVKDSLSFKKQIQTGYVSGQNIEVISGLEDGEIVVTIGQGSLQDSSKVNIINL